MIFGWLTCLFLLSPSALAFTYSVAEVKGQEAFYYSAGSSHRGKLQAGMKVEDGDSVETGKQSVLFLESNNGHKVQVGPNSKVLLKQPAESQGEIYNVMELMLGSVHAVIKKGDGTKKKFELRKNGIFLGVRGTDFLAVAAGDGMDVFLAEGVLLLQNEKTLLAGHQASMSASGEILKTALMSRFEFARAVERAGFGSESEENGGGASPPPPSPKGSAPEWIAKGNIARLKTLHLTKGELDQLTGEEGALHLAVKNRRPELVKYFLEEGASVDSEDSQGRTPLHLAIEAKQTSSIRALLDAGADKTKKDHAGRNAYDYARSTGQREIQALLQSAPAP